MLSYTAELHISNKYMGLTRITAENGKGILCTLLAVSS